MRRMTNWMHLIKVRTGGFVALALVSITLLSHVPPVQAGDGISGADFVRNELLISITPAASSAVSADFLKDGLMGYSPLDRLHVENKVRKIAPVFPMHKADPSADAADLARVYKVTLEDEADLFSARERYAAHPDIEYVELNLVYRATVIPSDSDFEEQWALRNLGGWGAKEGADIDVVAAWNIEKGDKRVKVAIVDTGIDTSHPDIFKTQVLKGRDFVNGDNNAHDDQGHGTFVAGVVAARTNNRKGIAGVCWKCKLLPVKVLDDEGSGTSEWVAQGIRYAADKKAKIINMSLGYEAGCGCSRTVGLAINYAWNKGSLLIAASGNDSNKEEISYPAASSRVLAVGASDKNDHEADFSNYSDHVDMLAPGDDIYGLDARPGEEPYRTARGTSAAAPHVAGVAALVWSNRLNLTNAEVWDVLRSTTDSLSSAPTGRLNARKAVTSTRRVNYSPPQDSCSGEPSSCSVGCGAEISLTQEWNFLGTLGILRSFRDQIMTPSRLGSDLADLYKKHQIQTAILLLADADFRQEVRLGIRQWMPIVEAALQGNREMVLTQEHIAAAGRIFDGFLARGDRAMRDDITDVRSTLEARGYLRAGVAVGALLDLLRRDEALLPTK